MGSAKKFIFKNLSPELFEKEIKTGRVEKKMFLWKLWTELFEKKILTGKCPKKFVLTVTWTFWEENSKQAVWEKNEKCFSENCDLNFFIGKFKTGGVGKKWKMFFLKTVPWTFWEEKIKQGVCQKILSWKFKPGGVAKKLYF